MSKPTQVVNLLVFDVRHPINLFLSTLFTVLLSLGLGFSWPYANGSVILESVIITTVLAVGLTLYTFWAARKGHDFGILLPFLYGFYMVLVVYGVIRLFFPSGKIVMMTYEALFVILFSGCIVYHTHNLIKRFPSMNTFGLLSVYGVTSAIFVLIIALLGGEGYDWGR
ncbi:protein LIFEGUARD 2-like isoform X2 [Tasmannia lanceolata]|uniref:protein LIFEGUARD 2-like isoform X2 n=1 Tax=Tasmannia lanceolata TaxID=3420 RepID=UPI0040642650